LQQEDNARAYKKLNDERTISKTINHMKRLLILTTILMAVMALTAQPVRNEILIPSLEGYEVLKCDFHMHTVFSDGSVWPTVRVGEAWQEGLDAMAITDHLEYLPHRSHITPSPSAPWEIARKVAEAQGMILIRGTEITKGMPPGHFNALFVKDEAKILNEDYIASLREAKAQGAFVLWNHPGWKAQAPDGAVWMPEHEALYQEGLFTGMEVVNHNEWYPEVLTWARDKNLTLFANSDVHDPILNFLQLEKLERRPITLVFARERNAEAIREALDDRRTVAWFRNLLMGEPLWLEKLVRASVSQRVIADDGKTLTLQLINLSDLSFELAPAAQPGKVSSLPARSSVILRIAAQELGKPWQWVNLLTRPGQPLELPLPLK